MFSMNKVDFDDLTISEFKTLKVLADKIYTREDKDLELYRDLIKMNCDCADTYRIRTTEGKYMIMSGGIHTYAIDRKTNEVVFYGWLDEESDKKEIIECRTNDEPLLEAIDIAWDRAYEKLNEFVETL